MDFKEYLIGMPELKTERLKLKKLTWLTPSLSIILYFQKFRNSP